jgi:anthranilate 1,2-dioxygenase small subunit
MSTMNLELQARVAYFVASGALKLDRDQLEDWLEDFSEKSRYLVLPRENLERGYQVGVMSCESKAILADRLSVLRNANKFNPHYDRHIISATVLNSVDAATGIVSATTPFIVVQTTLEGVSKLFVSGSYEDKIQTGGEYRIVERIVVLDTFSVPNCLATPL